jgi:hypothetical protein
VLNLYPYRRLLALLFLALYLYTKPGTVFWHHHTNCQEVTINLKKSDEKANLTDTGKTCTVCDEFFNPLISEEIACFQFLPVSWNLPVQTATEKELIRLTSNKTNRGPPATELL